MIGIEDEDFGQRQGVRRPRRRQGRLEDDLKKHAKSNLAAAKTPKEVEFLDELPRNATGKVLKRELEEKEAEKPGREVQSAWSTESAAPVIAEVRIAAAAEDWRRPLPAR